MTTKFTVYCRNSESSFKSCSWCDAYRGGANDRDSFLISYLDQLSCLCFRDALGYNGYSVNLETQLNKTLNFNV